MILLSVMTRESERFDDAGNAALTMSTMIRELYKRLLQGQEQCMRWVLASAGPTAAVNASFV